MPQLRHLPTLGICHSSFGAGVPVKAKWSWIWYAFDGGVTSLSCCCSLKFILWLCQWTLSLCTWYNPPGSALPSLSLFLSFLDPYSCPIFISNKMLVGRQAPLKNVTAKEAIHQQAETYQLIVDRLW